MRVTNVDEPGSFTLSSTQPETETALTATLTDPDVVGATTWKWERSTSRTSGWAEITGETTGSYTPVAGDRNHYLRVTAAYTDGHGSGKSLMAIGSNPVQLRPPDNTAPDFGSTTATRSVDENSAADINVGAPVTATDPSGLADMISVTINVTDVNERPTAMTDMASTTEDTAVTFEVLANDSDPETMTANLTVSLGSTRPRNGGVTLDSTTKEFTYTPNQDSHEADSFTYTLFDAKGRVLSAGKSDQGESLADRSTSYALECCAGLPLY